MRYTWVEFKRAVLSLSFLLSAVAMAAVMIYCANETVTQLFKNELMPSDVMIGELCRSVLNSDTALFAIPIVATVPFSCCFLDDMSSHFVKELLTRVSKRNYTVSKTIALIMSAGFSAVLSIALFELTMYILCVAAGGVPAVDAAMLHLSITLMGKYFAFFALWAVCGALIGTGTDSKCVVYASPFIVYYLLIIIKSRYLHTVDAIDPRIWCSSTGGVITIVSLLTILGVSAYIMVRRRLKVV